MMGNQWVSGLLLVFLSMFLVATEYTSLGAQNSTRSCHERERQVLLEFKNSVDDDCGVLSSWVGTNCCSWKGVRCDGATGGVVGLHLRGNLGDVIEYYTEKCFLVGDKVNAHIAKLRHLQHLDLSGNFFKGSQIPEFIGSFKQLSYLNLSNAHFSGIIPHHIGNLSNLKVLYLGRNYNFQGLDVGWVSSLSSLDHLDLSYVDLSQAKNIVMVFHIIHSLTYLSLSHCRLSIVHLGLHLNSSKILPNIQHLDLGFNHFEGQLPQFFQNMTSLTFLDLSFYNFSLVNSLKLLNMFPSLSELHLLRCGLNNAHFSPTYNLNFSAHPNLQYLDLSGNSIGGRFPSELMNMTSLRVLDLSLNSLNSSIPIALTSMTSLRVLDLAGNYLNSSIPVMPNLIKLDVSYNEFDNMEVVGIRRQCYLKELSLVGNHFGGEMIGPSSNTYECSQYALEILYSSYNQVNGPIPEFLGRLTSLKELYLTANGFTGSIPKSLERLRSLEVLDLSDNALNGSIPASFGRLRSLEVLDLSYNALTGSIPESLGRLTGLTHLSLQSNRVTGAIPTSLGRLDSLKELRLASNLLTGQIPVSIGQLTKLVDLYLFKNSLEGVVSEAHFAKLSMLKNLETSDNYKLIFNISHEWTPPFQMKMVSLGSCKIANGFPRWLQTQRKLRSLYLSNASLHGLLPTFFQKMPMLYVLDLSYNKFSGSLRDLPFSKYTETLRLQENHFSGSLSWSLCRNTHLIEIDVSRNQLSGNIPKCIGNLHKLDFLILSSNKLSGVLPSSLGNISLSLRWLKLDGNNFNGELSHELGNLRSLRVLDLGYNNFSGSIPKWMGETLTYLTVLSLHKNNFTGSIPQSLCRCSRLQILDIAHNNLKGSTPRCFGEMTGMIEKTDLFLGNRSSDTGVNQVMKGCQLGYTTNLDLLTNMDLSSNNLTGEIPPEITALVSLMGLNLSHNHLSGRIPYTIGKMKALYSLDFSDNQLTGTIPPSMAALNFLSFMNLSYNNLSGRIPTGNQLQTLTNPSIYAGNTDLCGAPLPNNCSTHENPPITISKNKYEDVNEPKKVWFYLDITCGFATGFWGVIGVLSFKKQWRQKLFKIAEVAMDKVFVMVAVRVSKIKRGREAI